MSIFSSTFRPIFRIFCVLCVLTGSLVTACAEKADESASPEELVPHKALYEIKLTSTRSGAQIVNIYGRMLYEWQVSCEAWTSNHRFDITYEYADSPSMRLTSDFSLYETLDGRNMDYTSQRKRDGQLFEEVRGHANLEEGGGGQAVFSIPKDLVYDLPKDTLFPMGHTTGVIEAIRQGKEFYNASIFDGSDDEGVVNVNAFIGSLVKAEEIIKPSEDIDEDLLKSPAHKVRLAFFPLNDPATTADYEMDLVFHENGVVSDIAVSYEDFSVSQKLVALEPLQKASCAGHSGKE